VSVIESNWLQFDLKTAKLGEDAAFRFVYKAVYVLLFVITNMVLKSPTWWGVGVGVGVGGGWTRAYA